MTIPLFTATAVQAQECKNPQTQTEMNHCATMELEAATGELKKVYNEYLIRLSEEQKKQIQEAQLVWIRFRDLTCKFESSGSQGGSAYGMVFSFCLTRMTRERTKQLQELASCKEGDLSCPAWK